MNAPPNAPSFPSGIPGSMAKAVELPEPVKKSKDLLIASVFGAIALLISQVIAKNEKVAALLGDNKDAAKALVQIVQAVITLGSFWTIYVLLPKLGKVSPGKGPAEVRDTPKPPKPDAVGTVGASVSQEDFERVVRENRNWKKYDDEVKSYVERVSSYEAEVAKYIENLNFSRAQLDNRQVVLRIAIFGMIGLAFMLMLTGLLAPPFALSSAVTETAASRAVTPTVDGAPHLSEEGKLVFLKHVGWTLASFSMAGIGMGIAVRVIRVKTFRMDAYYCALRSATVLSLSAMLVAMPYLIRGRAMVPVVLGSISMPMSAWLAIMRIIVAPFLCALASMLGFFGIEKLEKLLQKSR